MHRYRFNGFGALIFVLSLSVAKVMMYISMLVALLFYGSKSGAISTTKEAKYHPAAPNLARLWKFFIVFIVMLRSYRLFSTSRIPIL